MKRILLILLTLSVLLSCDRNLLDATKTPDKINLDDIEGFEYKYVDVKPEVAPDGVVFGAYGSRFKFGGEWYVFTRNIYKYDGDKKILKNTGSNAILKVANENNLIIYAKNLPESADTLWPEVGHNWHDKYNNNAMYNFTLMKELLVVKDDMIYNEFSWAHNYKYKVNYLRRTVDSGDLGQFGVDEIDAYWPTSMTVERNGRGKTYTKDLVNWTTEYRYGESWTPINFPSPTFDFDEDDYPHDNNFNGRAGVVWPAIVHFKGYVYILGGYDMGREKIDKLKKKTYNLALKHYYRLDVSKNGAVAGNWEYRGVPFGRRASMLVRINEEEGKMYINDGVSAKMEVDPYAVKNDDKVNYSFKRDFQGDIWSTSDGINWNKDSKANWDKASYVDYANGSKYIGPDPGPAFPKSDEEPSGMFYPDYTEINGLYYRISKVSINNPDSTTLPDKVEDARAKGETNYIVTEQDIIDADVSKLQVSSVHPNIAKESDWKTMPAYNPITSGLWMNGSAMLFNINGKLIRLANYAGMDNETEYYSHMANYNLNEHKVWYQRALDGGYTNISEGTQRSRYTCYFLAMSKQSRASIFDYYATNMIKHYMPDKAITHYSIDLSNAE